MVFDLTGQPSGVYVYQFRVYPLFGSMEKYSRRGSSERGSRRSRDVIARTNGEDALYGLGEGRGPDQFPLLGI